MEFRTPLTVDTSLRGLLDYGDDRPVIMLGSCFSDNMAGRLEDSLFNVVANPFGTLYNPLSIAAAAERLVSGERFKKTDLVKDAQGIWHSFMHHSSFSCFDRNLALKYINRALVSGHKAISNARCVIVTLGTAWVFSLVDTQTVVANCHKFPSNMFTRRRMSVDEVVEALERIRLAVAPAPLLLTVSPVRHAADGMHGNTLSKAILHLAVEQSGLPYFPAYEALIDDLRDYRFTAADMRHPSETACDYIFSLMCDALMTPASRALVDTARRFTRMASHRPMVPGTARPHHKKLLSMSESLRAEASPLADAALRYLKDHDLLDF